MQAKIDVVSADDYDKLVTEKSAAAVNAWQAKERRAQARHCFSGMPAEIPAPVARGRQPACEAVAALSAF